ncbi:hypothetical protein LTR17_010871 [Elasticomyces elasticus]|nr:hypothetical protein LTR17_010871 [Elasticomyces elasticus]
MAFRKYYTASLSPHTQKAFSKIRMTWWRDDPFSAKWAILAKAYIILRGSREKEDAPLDHFLALAVPLMGIVPPRHYQSMMGWQLIAGSNGDQFNISFNPLEETVGLADGGIYDAFDPSASMSVDDMLNLDWSQFVNDDSTA